MSEQAYLATKLENQLSKLEHENAHLRLALGTLAERAQELENTLRRIAETEPRRVAVAVVRGGVLSYEWDACEVCKKMQELAREVLEK